MSGLIFLAILFYAVSYIAKEGKAKRKAGGAAPAQQPIRVSPQPEGDVELCTHDRPEAFRPAEPFREAYSGSLNYVSTEGEGTESVACSLTGHNHPDAHAETPDAETHLPAEPVSRPFLSAADRDACKRAVIYAEILGKPRAMHR